MESKYVILGTAGHIDHGKSQLVKALTGIDPDRLKEEKERGITIDLGFADIEYPDGIRVGIVDVPGHERLVKNMLAGAGGIDLVVLVIAADEGIMPQSREHLAICNLLGIKSGIIAITKTDLVDKEWLEMVIEEVKEFVRETFLHDAEIVPVSSVTGENIELLKEKIHELAMRVKPKSADGLFRLPIDRVFTLKGFGTVITGTVLSGTIALNDEVEILPVGIRSKVRGLQSHGRAIERGYAGQRLAINLQGVEKKALKRGDTVVLPGRFRITHNIDARISLLNDAPILKNRSNIHFHLATSEVVGRVILYDHDELKAGEEAFCQIRLEEPVLAVSGDRFIIRRFSPVETIGGGVVLDPWARRRKKKEGLDDLVVYEGGNLREKIETKIRKAGLKGINIDSIAGWINEGIRECERAVQSLLDRGKIYKYNNNLIHGDTYKALKERIIDALERFHKNNPLKTGMSKEVLRGLFGIRPELFDGILSITDDVVVEKDVVRLKGFKVAVTEGFQELKKDILNLMQQKRFQPPTKNELARYFGMKEKEIDDILRLMTEEGELVRLTDSIYLRTEDYRTMIDRIKDFYNNNDTMTVGQFRDLLGTSRKYALPFLEYLDSNRFTLRVGDVRKIHPSFKKQITAEDK
ncbi:MAG: selenocysteine-specific translation elongation factor [Nitrospirae bacterium]|nr:selenocysteine-specific translation elongation factor [Nitrospirota bacterium]